MAPQHVGHILRRAVPKTNPDDPRRSPADDTQTMKVLVLRDEDALVFEGQLPNDGIWCSASPQLPDMKRLGEQVASRSMSFSERDSSKSSRTASRHAAGTLSVRRSRSAA